MHLWYPAEPALVPYLLHQWERNTQMFFVWIEFDLIKLCNLGADTVKKHPEDSHLL